MAHVLVVRVVPAQWQIVTVVKMAHVLVVQDAIVQEQECIVNANVAKMDATVQDALVVKMVLVHAMEMDISALVEDMME